MTTSHVQYLTVTAQGVRVGDVLLSTTRTAPRRPRRRDAERRSAADTEQRGVHPLRPQDTAYILRHHHFGE
ncbi:hypothetical protein NKH77_20075 [Streptomyces sp. M19]